MNKTFFAAITCTCLLANCVGAADERQTIDGHLPPATANLQPMGRLDGAQHLNLDIGLAPRDEQGLDAFLRQLYDPASPAYHHYLTPDQFTERFSASEANYQALVDYAAANGLTVTRKHANRVVLSVEGTVSNIEKALQVTLRIYQHPTEARTFYAPDAEPSLPLRVNVLHISGLDNLTLPHPKIRRRSGPQKSGADPQNPVSHGSAPSSCGSGALWGWDYRNAYVPGTTLNGAGQNIGLLEFETFYPVDITNYWVNALGQPASNTPTVVTVVVGSNPGVTSDNGGECTLDIEMGMAMAPAISKIYVFAGTGSFDSIFESMVTYTNIRQFSCSWGGGTAADPTSEVLFKQMQAQGQSFFNATGDNGAFPIGTATLPSDSPSITQVGGSFLTDGPAPAYAWASESAWSQVVGPTVSEADASSSSGGISAYYAIPYWQTNINMTTNLGSTSYRNFPDVSMNAEENNVISDNNGTIADCGNGGTSFAAPLWAGLCALINQQAAAYGDGPIGFLNPALYALYSKSNAYTSYFHDITVGNDTWVDSPTEFYAEPGYDLVCGIGTPMGTNLINALAPPALVVQPAASSLFTGPVGGPFSPNPQTFVLSNASPESITWTFSDSITWLDASDEGGTLLPGSATNVILTLDPSAMSLPAGYYVGVVTISNLTGGATQSIGLYLAVGLTNLQLGAYTAQQTVYAGQSAVFSVSLAAGNFATYQWQYVTNGTTNILKNGPINNNSAVFGATTSSLTISNVLPSDAGYYTCYITNASPSSTNSPLAQLTVLLGAPAVAVDVPASQTGIAQSPTMISASFIGALPISYQWSFNGQPLGNGARISGATSNVLTINQLMSGDAGTYQLWASNSFGTNVSGQDVLIVSSNLTFNNTATGWSLNGTSEGGFVASNLLELTAGTTDETRSSFFSNQVYVGAFQATFTYRNVKNNATDDGNGLCFVIQNDSRGAAAVGTDGANLGYNNTTASLKINPSVALEFNVYSNNGIGGTGLAFGTDGAIAHTAGTGFVSLVNGDPINVTVNYYPSGQIHVAMQDAISGLKYSTNVSINIPSVVGSNVAYVGFTGSTLGTNQESTQTISNFLFTVEYPPTFAVVPTNTTVTNGGGPVVFYSSATGMTPLGYQWQLNGANLTNGPSPSGSGATISGSLTSNLTIIGYTLADNAESYTVVATNLAGTNSASAVLTVLSNVVVVPPTQLSGITVSGAQFIFSYTTVAGASYQLESTMDLNSGVWVPAGSPVLGTGSPIFTTNSISSTGQQFFRLSITP